MFPMAIKPFELNVERERERERESEREKEWESGRTLMGINPLFVYTISTQE